MEYGTGAGSRRMNKHLQRFGALCLAASMTLTPLGALAQDPDTGADTGTVQEPQNNSQPETPWQNQNLADLVNVSDIRVLVDGQEADSWDQDQTADVKLVLTCAQPTRTFTSSSPGPDPEGISVTRLSDAFKGGDPEITLMSEPEAPLRMEAVFRNVQWRGKEDGFSFSLQVQQSTARKDLHIYEASPKDPEPAPAPEAPASPEPIVESPGGFSDAPASADAGSSAPKKIQTATPHLIISKYSYGKDPVEAGRDFDLNVEFRNTSKSLGVENVVMSVETGEGLNITNASNTYYFDSIPAGGAKTQTISMKAASADKNASPACQVSFAYEYVDGDQRMEKTSQEKIAIPVVQADRFQLEQPANLTPATAGMEYTLSIPYQNKGKGTVYNVSAYVEGDMKTLSAKQNLGNIDAGRTGSIDLILTPDKPGEHKFKAVISYENASEQEVKKTFDVTLQVEKAAPVVSGETAENPGQQAAVPWGWIIAALAAAAGLGWFVVRRKKKAKASQQAEDLDSLFGDGDETR